MKLSRGTNLIISPRIHDSNERWQVDTDRSGPVVTAYEIEGSRERRVVIAYKKGGTTSFFSALSDLYHSCNSSPPPWITEVHQTDQVITNDEQMNSTQLENMLVRYDSCPQMEFGLRLLTCHVHHPQNRLQMGSLSSRSIFIPSTAHLLPRIFFKSLKKRLSSVSPSIRVCDTSLTHSVTTTVVLPSNPFFSSTSKLSVVSYTLSWTKFLLMTTMTTNNCTV